MWKYSQFKQFSHHFNRNKQFNLSLASYLLKESSKCPFQMTCNSFSLTQLKYSRTFCQERTVEGGWREKDEKLKICPRTIVIKLQLKILHPCTSLSITWTIFLWLRLEKPRWTCFVMTVLYESLCESPIILSVHFPDPIDYFSINFCFSLPFPFILTLFKVFD